MSNQYYKFLANQLLEYLDRTQLISGNRYYLILNSDQEINNLENEVSKINNDKVSKFTSLEFDYNTVAYNVNGINTILVFAKKDVTHDFLVTIRNKVSLQKAEWKNTAVVFVVKENLDSITNGASSLSKQGSPFHTNQLKRNLKDILEDRHQVDTMKKLSLEEKRVLDFIVENNFDDEFANYTLMDFESVFSILEQGEITDEDYYQLGLFKDNSLSSFSGNEMKNRLKENKQMFEEISGYHDRGNAKERIEDNFAGDSTVKSLSHEKKWQDTDFENVIKARDKMIGLKKIKIEFLDTKFQDQFKLNEVWDKPSGKTKSKQRERNIIIFNDGKPLQDIIIPFDTTDSIHEKHIVSRSSKFYDLESKEKVQLDFGHVGRDKLKVMTSQLSPTNTYYLEFTYKHNNENPHAFKFKILIVNFESKVIESFRTSYIFRFNAKEKMLEWIMTSEDNIITFGNGDNQQIENVSALDSVYYIEKDKKHLFDFNTLVRQDIDNINMYFVIDEVTHQLTLSVVSNKPFPASATLILRNIYAKQKSMLLNGKTLTQGNEEYYLHADFKKTLEYESTMIENCYFAGQIVGNEFLEENLELSEEIKSAYLNLCNTIKSKNTLPSVMYFDEEIINAATKYCELVESKIEGLPDNKIIIENEVKNIHRIGMIQSQEGLYMTPLHPLLLRYEIEKTKKIGNEELHERILKKYNAASLLPFYIIGNDYYFSEYDEQAPRWLTYKPYKKTNKLSSELTSFIVTSRISDFKKHFKYLFEVNYQFALKVRFINLSNTKVLFNGIITHLLDEFEKATHLNYVNPIDVYLDEQTSDYLIQEFYNTINMEHLSELFNIKIKPKLVRKFELDDILAALKDKINVYKTNEEMLYHITFYNFNQEPRFSINDTNQLTCSVNENGLLSNMSYTKIGNEYSTGFGLMGIPNKNSLIKTSVLFNSLAANARNNHLNPYQHNESIVNNVTSLDQQNIKHIFDKTNWVTFIDPSVDLSYFNDSAYDLYVIHYNDQTSSQNYESITVTDDTDIYEKVLIEFLSKIHPSYNVGSIENVIRSFNILNGEWLLKIVGSRNNKALNVDHTVREKLSIISAYKNLLVMLEQTKVVWIPVSLEEILRVSRQQGLDMSSDIFSAKVLEHKGSISDDLLYLGLEIDETMNVKVHFLPVEVKIGINDSSVMKKASEQITHLFNLLDRHLVQDNKDSFTQHFYRTFFLNIYFANLKKFIDNGLLKSDKYLQMFENKSWILNEDVQFSNEINYSLAEGIIFSFRQGQVYRKVIKNKATNQLEVVFSEFDGYVDAEKEYYNIKDEILTNKKGVDLKIFIEASDYPKGIVKTVEKEIPDEQEEIEDEMIEVDRQTPPTENIIEYNVENNIDKVAETQEVYVVEAKEELEVEPEEELKVELKETPREEPKDDDDDFMSRIRATRNRMFGGKSTEDKNDNYPVEVPEVHNSKHHDDEVKNDIKEQEIKPYKEYIVSTELLTDNDLITTDDPSSPNLNDELNDKHDKVNSPITEANQNPNKFIDPNVRIPIGTIAGSTKKMYWEYGNKLLPNRHLLITGKSGQGKTYFMQCLLYEFAKQNLDSLIIDYTDGFLPNQLEPTFVEELGDKINNRFVFASKLPINPFKREQIDLGGMLFPEKDDDVADRVVQIIDFVFSLGIQQNNLLKETIIEGLRIHDENYTFTKLKNDLSMLEGTQAQSLMGRINTLLNKDPFTYNEESFDWSNVFNFAGKVNIVQLKGFAQDVQKVITEFLLWDLYNYSQREGNKNKPIPVLLDEMQNLNHRDSSPTNKILREGRKFGWSSWLATQSISSIKNAGGDTSALYNAAMQIHFAAPEDQIPIISKMLSTDIHTKRLWENKLSTLNKGECIVSGYFENGDNLEKVTEVVKIDSLESRL